jgi:hypothetical protein
MRSRLVGGSAAGPQPGVVAVVYAGVRPLEPGRGAVVAVPVGQAVEQAHPLTLCRRARCSEFLRDRPGVGYRPGGARLGLRPCCDQLRAEALGRRVIPVCGGEGLSGCCQASCSQLRRGDRVSDVPRDDRTLFSPFRSRGRCGIRRRRCGSGAMPNLPCAVEPPPDTAAAQPTSRRPAQRGVSDSSQYGLPAGTRFCTWITSRAEVRVNSTCPLS